jgi:TolA-binding protein
MPIAAEDTQLPPPTSPGALFTPEARSAGVKTTAKSINSPSWKQLALDERYVRALSAAEAEHFDVICRQAPAVDLLLLANAARFAGSTRRAVQAFQSIRERFPRTTQATLAAFSLGRLAYDRQRRFAEAATWFTIYLTEEPEGVLAREAAGRLIEAQRDAGNTAAAREAATTYLTRYPHGPHATVARSLTR